MTSDKGVVERLRDGMVRRPVNAVTDAGVMDPNATAVIMREAARIETLERALRPFARIADMTDDEADGASVIVNVSRCREASAALSPSTNGAEK